MRGDPQADGALDDPFHRPPDAGSVHYLYCLGPVPWLPSGHRAAPYVHARTVLALRSGLEGAGLLIAGHARSVEAHGYVERGWAADLSAPRNLVRRAVARVEALCRSVRPDRRY